MNFNCSFITSTKYSVASCKETEHKNVTCFVKWNVSYFKALFVGLREV